jgi:hypothetical protein
MKRKVGTTHAVENHIDTTATRGLTYTRLEAYPVPAPLALAMAMTLAMTLSLSLALALPMMALTVPGLVLSIINRCVSSELVTALAALDATRSHHDPGTGLST